MGLLTVLPALIFFVALGLLIAKVRYPLDASPGYRIFEVLCWLAASYIPGYIIFALVTDLPRNQDLNNIRPFLANQTAMIAGGGQGLLRELAKAAGYEAGNPPTKEDFVEVCERINPSDPAPRVRRLQPLEYVTWLELLFEYRYRSAQASEKLFQFMSFLDSEHIRLIIRIDESALFRELDSYRAIYQTGVPIRSPDLTWLADSLFRYYRLTRELQQYADRHLKGLAWLESRD
jgi:hypothetical protein